MTISPAVPPPQSEQELEELLTRPTAETVDAVSRLAGDILVLGAGGKMGPSLARLAKRSLEAAGLSHRVVCVSRFSDAAVAERLHTAGIDVIPCDLLDRTQLAALPDAPNIAYLAGFKFGASGAPYVAWAMNCFLPALVAERFRGSRIVALSTGNVYPYVPPESGGADEATEPSPIGEYAQSCLGRERMFEYASARDGTRILLVRLNYATDLRYGVLLDIARKVMKGEPVDVSMGWVNTIWQGDANAVVIRGFEHCSAPPTVLNLTGPEMISVRETAERFALMLGAPAPTFVGSESDVALLSNAHRCRSLFGPPQVSVETLLAWTAGWVATGGATLGKPTHFETRDGKF